MIKSGCPIEMISALISHRVSTWDSNRCRRRRPKVNTSIFDSALDHYRRSEASEKREENSVSTFGPFRLLKSFESSPVSGNLMFFPV